MTSSSTLHLTQPSAIVLFTGCVTAIVLPFIAFLIFVINRSLRVKRLHIISINICFSLIILYVGFLISLLSSDRGDNYTANAQPACITGALLVLLGWFCLHFWILANWIFLTFTIQQRVSRHISHFFIKSTIPTYGTALLFFVVIASMDATQSQKNLVNGKFCWFDLHYEQGVEWVFFLATTLCGAGILGCAIFCCVKFTGKKEKNASTARIRKNKMAVVRLVLLTLVVFLTSALQLSWWSIFSRDNDFQLTNNNEIPAKYSKKVTLIDINYSWLKILHGIFIAIEGISVVLYLMLPKDNFHSILAYCTAVIKCQDLSTVQHHNVRSTVRTSKHADNNNIIDARTSLSSDDRPKYEPREEVANDDVFVAPDKGSTPNLSTPTDKRKSRVSTAKQDRNSPVSSRNRPNDLGSLRPNASHSKKRGIRVSFRKSVKSPLTPTPSSGQPSVSDLASSAPTSHFHFNRDSKLSMKCEHERKTSF